MISPEVIQFLPPRVLSQTLSSNEKTISQQISSGKLGNYAHAVTIVLPNIYPVPLNLVEICNTFLYYHVEKFPAYRLIEKEFLLTFVQKGHLIAKSLFQWNDVDQAIELNSSGKLKLSVDKDLYQELGLNGVPSFMLGKVPTKYTITIDLLNPKFQPGSKYYERVFRCLKKHLSLEFDWIMKWEPHDLELCPSTLAAYLDLAQFKVSECKPQLKQHQLFNSSIPQLNQETDLADLVEWVGATVMEIECPLEESHASSFTCQQPHLNADQVSILECKGFLSIQEIEITLRNVLEILKEDDCKLWYNLTIYGFDDHPSTGSNITSIFATPSDGLHLYTLRSPTNRVK